MPRTQAQGRSGEVEGRTQQGNQVGQQQTPNQQALQQANQKNQQQNQQHGTLYDTLNTRRGTTDTYGIRGRGGGPPSHHASQVSLQKSKDGSIERAPSAADNRSLRGSRRELASKSVDYSDLEQGRESDTLRRRVRSKSTDDVSKGDVDASTLPELDSSTLERMLKPISSNYQDGTEYLYGIKPKRIILPLRPFSPENKVETPIDRIGNRAPAARLSYCEGMGENYSHGMGRLRSAVSFTEGTQPPDSPPSEFQLFNTRCYATTPSPSRRLPALKFLTPRLDCSNHRFVVPDLVL